MYTIIGGDQKEYGPATAEEIRRWIAEGRLSTHSLVRAQGGAADWKALGQLPEFAEALQAQAKTIAASPGLPPLTTGSFIAQVAARVTELRLGRCLALAWKLWWGNFGLLFAASFLVWMIGLICQFHYLTAALYTVVRGVFFGGLCLVFLHRIRGQPAAVGDVFGVFGAHFAQLLLAGFLSFLLSFLASFCCFLPGIYLFVAWIFAIPLVADKTMEFWSAMEVSRKIVTRVWFQVFGLMLLAFLPFIIMSLAIQVKLSLDIYPTLSQLLTASQPDVQKIVEFLTHPPKLSLTLVLLAQAVLLLNLPFGMGALMYAYEDLFGTRPSPTT
jgi:hypothetical protein